MPAVTKQLKLDWKPKRAIELGYFLVKPSCGVSGQIAPVDRGKLSEVVGVGPTSLERAIEAKLDAHLKLKLKTKIDQSKLEEVVDAIRNPGSDPAKRIFTALAKTLGLEVGHSGENFAVQSGFEASETPFYVTVKWNVKEVVELPERAEFSGEVNGRLYFGLSRRGWEEVGRRVGKAALEEFFKKAGPQLARLGAWLVTSGVLTGAAIAAGAIGGTFLLVGLSAIATENARRSGAIRGIEAWYVSAYAAKVFGLPRPSGYVSTYALQDAAHLATQAIHWGEHDAVSDARHTATTMFQDPDAATVPEAVLLQRHRNRLERGAGSRENAIHYLKQELLTKARFKLGLR